MRQMTGAVWIVTYWWQIVVFAAAIDLIFWSTIILIGLWKRRRK